MKNFLLTFILVFCSSSNMIYANNLDNEDLKLPLPMPYKGVLIDKNTLDKFVESAINSNKKPMLVFGANWCGDCRILFGTFELPTFKKMLDENYSILKIDVKRYEINMHIMNELGLEPKKGIPRVVIMDNKKNILNLESTFEWTTARDRTKQEMFDYFEALSKL